jgi:hypothetical protein
MSASATSGHPTHFVPEVGSGAILQAAAQVVAAGATPDAIAETIEARLREQYEAHIESLLAGEATIDLSRLALLVAADGLDATDAEELVLRDVDDAIFDAEHRLEHPRNGDDRVFLLREIARLHRVRKRRELVWGDEFHHADFALDAAITYTEAAPVERPVPRPGITLDEARTRVRTAIADAIADRASPHVLIDSGTSTAKTSTMIEEVAAEAVRRREERQQWMIDYCLANPRASQEDAADAANGAGIRLPRVRYVGEHHKQVAVAVALARSLGLTAEHHGGYGRAFDPSDLTAPAVCTQPERRGLTEQAGEPVPDKACRGCVDRDGCRRWQRLGNCGRVEFVGMVTDDAFNDYLPHQLAHGFDLTIWDEAPDRAGYAEHHVPLDLLSARHFEAHPVRDDLGNPDPDRTDDARREYKLVCDILEAAPNGYAPIPAMRAAGFDSERLLRLVDATNSRDAPSGITWKTPDAERRALAKESFRRQVSTICTLFRALADPGEGRVRLDDAESSRVALVNTIRTVHPSILERRIIALDGTPDITSWRRFIPDIEVVDIPRPIAPFETAVQIVRPNGQHAMRRPERKAYDLALVHLYGQGRDHTGVLTHLEHEAAFEYLALAGHYGDLTSRNDWKNCGTIFSFGVPFLSPEGAAYNGAARTGEAVPIAMPVRTLRPVMMKAGGVTLVPSMEYEHPAAREAQAAVRDRQAMQGPGGRGRAPLRTAENPLLSIYVGRGVVPGMMFDYVITSPEEFAPDRFVRMVAAELVVASPRHRHRVHPEIYPKPHSAEYDVKHETGGMIAALQRVLYPKWWGDRPRPPWAVLRYWLKGRGNRTSGFEAACPEGRVAWAAERLRVDLGAVRVEFVASVHRPRHHEEVSRSDVNTDSTWILGTYPRRAAGPLFGEADKPPRSRAPPDG